MTSIKKAIALTAFTITAMTAFAQHTLFDTLSKPKLIADQFAFTEGCSVDKNGDVFFTDQPNDKIWKYEMETGKLSVFMEKSGRSNGTYFDKKGNLITCADDKGELWSISPKGKVKVLMTNLEGKQLNGPNDVWLDSKGGIYMTDPYYQRDYWTRKHSALDGEHVYYLPKGSKSPIKVIGDMRQPNGIVGTPDGKYLYVSDLGAQKTYRYTINKDATLSDKTLLFNVGSDGMTLDELGNIYITGRGVTIFSPDGKKIANIPNTDKWTGNVCFAGKNRDILFITASKSIYTLKMNVRGVE
ncbi:SMP-30/gluconolactonase/LRE family protein [Mucilaginibacter panaciglaebae]|uniref:SMP-30/gluconolactonase/LRE family protein n=1 Tax=Mucilaginibacter panaciglaebae TaxID=502331 RepID=A0ABP7WFB4_9SPHI